MARNRGDAMSKFFSHLQQQPEQKQSPGPSLMHLLRPNSQELTQGGRTPSEIWAPQAAMAPPPQRSPDSRRQNGAIGPKSSPRNRNSNRRNEPRPLYPHSPPPSHLSSNSTSPTEPTYNYFKPMQGEVRSAEKTKRAMQILQTAALNDENGNDPRSFSQYLDGVEENVEIPAEMQQTSLSAVQISNYKTPNVERTFEHHTSTMGATRNYICYPVKEKEVRVIDVYKGKRALLKSVHDERIVQLVGCPSCDDVMASLSADGIVCVWEFQNMDGAQGLTETLLFRIQNDMGQYTQVLWQPSPNGHIGLLVAISEFNLHLYDVSRECLQMELTLTSAAATCAGFSPSGRCLAAGSDDGWVSFWVIHQPTCTPDSLDTFPTPLATIVTKFEAHPRCAVTHVFWVPSPHGYAERETGRELLLTSNCKAGEFKLWARNPDNKWKMDLVQCVRLAVPHPRCEFNQVSMSPDGMFCVTSYGSQEKDSNSPCGFAVLHLDPAPSTRSPHPMFDYATVYRTEHSIIGLCVLSENGSYEEARSPELQIYALETARVHQYELPMRWCLPPPNQERADALPKGFNFVQVLDKSERNKAKSSHKGEAKQGPGSNGAPQPRIPSKNPKAKSNKNKIGNVEVVSQRAVTKPPLKIDRKAVSKPKPPLKSEGSKRQGGGSSKKQSRQPKQPKKQPLPRGNSQQTFLPGLPGPSTASNKHHYSVKNDPSLPSGPAMNGQRGNGSMGHGPMPVEGYHRSAPSRSPKPRRSSHSNRSPAPMRLPEPWDGGGRRGSNEGGLPLFRRETPPLPEHPWDQRPPGEPYLNAHGPRSSYNSGFPADGLERVPHHGGADAPLNGHDRQRRDGGPMRDKRDRDPSRQRRQVGRGHGPQDDQLYGRLDQLLHDHHKRLHADLDRGRQKSINDIDRVAKMVEQLHRNVEHEVPKHVEKLIKHQMKESIVPQMGNWINDHMEEMLSKTLMPKLQESIQGQFVEAIQEALSKGDKSFAHSMAKVVVEPLQRSFENVIRKSLVPQSKDALKKLVRNGNPEAKALNESMGRIEGLLKSIQRSMQSSDKPTFFRRPEMGSDQETVEESKLKIQSLLDSSKIEEAFDMALASNSLPLIGWLCTLVDLSQILSTEPCTLSSSVLVALLQRFSVGLTSHDIQIEGPQLLLFIREILSGLELSATLTADTTSILEQVEQQVERFLSGDKGARRNIDRSVKCNVRVVKLLLRDLLSKSAGSQPPAGSPHSSHSLFSASPRGHKKVGPIVRSF